MCISVFDVMIIYPIGQYQNAIPRVMPHHELKQVQLQERFTLMTQDSIGHQKLCCMSVSLLSGGIESEWKHYSSPLSVEKKKTLAF